MIHKNKTFKINKEHIFLHDKLQREESIENLSSLVASTKEAFTMSINASWGTGKTTFVKLWQAYLKKEHKINSIYFSAWEDDFSNEPLISILGEINSYVSVNFEQKPEVKAKLEKVKSFGSKVIKRGFPAFVKGATSGALDLDKGFESAIGAISEETTKELINNYSKNKELTEAFQDAIKTLLNYVDEDKPFVIFIDELDRCRPLYAIELLERVKHIFGIDGLIFVLSVDKKQLSESIKSQYGNIDANSYLKRFIDLEYNLKNPNRDDFCSFLYNEYEIDKTIQSKEIKSSHGNLDHLSMMRYLIELLNLTLREIEQSFLQISIVFKTMEPRLYESHFRVFMFFIALKIKDQELYFDLIMKRKTADDLIKKLTFPQKISNSRHNFSTVVKSLVYATAIDEKELQTIIKEQQEILDKIQDQSGEEYQDQEWLVTLLGHKYGQWNDYKLNKLIETSIKKVEFLDKFNFEGNSE